MTGPATVLLTVGSNGDSVYTARITPNTAEEGDIVFRVSVAAVKDFARNDNEASTEWTVHVDTISPTVQITDVPTVEKNIAFDITITFSESCQRFPYMRDITFTGPCDDVIEIRD